MAGRAFYPALPPDESGPSGFDLPLLRPGALDAPTLDLYKLLGVKTISIVHEDTPYVTFAADATRAVDAFETLAPEDWGKPTRRVPAVASVPRWQSALGRAAAEFYIALGVRTTTLDVDGHRITFLDEGDDITEARREFDRRPIDRRPGDPPNPTKVLVPVKGLYLT